MWVRIPYLTRRISILSGDTVLGHFSFDIYSGEIEEKKWLGNGVSATDDQIHDVFYDIFHKLQKFMVFGKEKCVENLPSIKDTYEKLIFFSPSIAIPNEHIRKLNTCWKLIFCSVLTQYLFFFSHFALCVAINVCLGNLHSPNKQ